MLHHMSFNAKDPARVSSVLAEFLGTTAIRAPSPPFPDGAWFVCWGDEQASLVEVLPWGAINDPDAAGLAFDSEMRSRSGSHVLASGTRPASEVVAIAEREGWRAKIVNAGPFGFVKVFVENAFVFEVLTPEYRDDYVRLFGAAGITTLDAKLRQLESSLSAR